MVSNCFSSYYLVSSLQQVESHASSDTQPNQAALLFNTARIQPGSQTHQCVGGNTVHLATLVRAHCSRPPQESLVCDETPLPAKPSLTRTTLGQLCSPIAPVTTEPGHEPRVSAAVQRPYPLRHPGGLVSIFCVCTNRRRNPC